MWGLLRSSSKDEGDDQTPASTAPPPMMFNPLTTSTTVKSRSSRNPLSRQKRPSGSGMAMNQAQLQSQPLSPTGEPISPSQALTQDADGPTSPSSKPAYNAFPNFNSGESGNAQPSSQIGISQISGNQYVNDFDYGPAPTEYSSLAHEHNNHNHDPTENERQQHPSTEYSSQPQNPVESSYGGPIEVEAPAKPSAQSWDSQQYNHDQQQVEEVGSSQHEYQYQHQQDIQYQQQEQQEQYHEQHGDQGGNDGKFETEEQYNQAYFQYYGCNPPEGEWAAYQQQWAAYYQSIQEPDSQNNHVETEESHPAETQVVGETAAVDNGVVYGSPPGHESAIPQTSTKQLHPDVIEEPENSYDLPSEFQTQGQPDLVSHTMSQVQQTHPKPGHLHLDTESQMAPTIGYFEQGSYQDDFPLSPKQAPPGDSRQAEQPSDYESQGQLMANPDNQYQKEKDSTTPLWEKRDLDLVREGDPVQFSQPTPLSPRSDGSSKRDRQRSTSTSMSSSSRRDRHDTAGNSSTWSQNSASTMTADPAFPSANERTRFSSSTSQKSNPRSRNASSASQRNDTTDTLPPPPMFNALPGTTGNSILPPPQPFTSTPALSTSTPHELNNKMATFAFEESHPPMAEFNAKPQFQLGSSEESLSGPLSQHNPPIHTFKQPPQSQLPPNPAPERPSKPTLSQRPSLESNNGSKTTSIPNFPAQPHQFESGQPQSMTGDASYPLSPPSQPPQFAPQTSGQPDSRDFGDGDPYPPVNTQNRTQNPPVGAPHQDLQRTDFSTPDVQISQQPASHPIATSQSSVSQAKETRAIRDNVLPPCEDTYERINLKQNRRSPGMMNNSSHQSSVNYNNITFARPIGQTESRSSSRGSDDTIARLRKEYEERKIMKRTTPDSGGSTEHLGPPLLNSTTHSANKKLGSMSMKSLRNMSQSTASLIAAQEAYENVVLKTEDQSYENHELISARKPPLPPKPSVPPRNSGSRESSRRQNTSSRTAGYGHRRTGSADSVGSMQSDVKSRSYVDNSYHDNRSRDELSRSREELSRSREELSRSRNDRYYEERSRHDSRHDSRYGRYEHDRARYERYRREEMHRRGEMMKREADRRPYPDDERTRAPYSDEAYRDYLERYRRDYHQGYAYDYGRSSRGYNYPDSRYGADNESVARSEIGASHTGSVISDSASQSQTNVSDASDPMYPVETDGVIGSDVVDVVDDDNVAEDVEGSSLIDTEVKEEETATALADLYTTPYLYTQCHIRAQCFAPNRFLCVIPNEEETEPHSLEIAEFKLLYWQELKEIEAFPGPFIKGETPKRDVMNYCKKQASQLRKNRCTNDGEILLWELLALLCKQNGVVVGTDVAELLLADQDTTTTYASSNITGYNDDGQLVNITDEQRDEAINQIRECLFEGQRKEALEVSVKYYLWDMALMISTTLSNDIMTDTMQRFSKSLHNDDPLKSFHQLIAGTEPACCSETKKWREHLAMLLSNQSDKYDPNYNYIHTLARTLARGGMVHASHFACIMAGTKLTSVVDKTSPISLLGLDHTQDGMERLPYSAIQLTEIYEYCKLLGGESCIVPFQAVRLFYAREVAKVGLYSKSLQYLKQIANNIVLAPKSYRARFIMRVYEESVRMVNLLRKQRPDWVEDLRNTLTNRNLDNSNRSTAYSSRVATPDIQKVAQYLLYKQGNVAQQQQHQQPAQQQQQPAQQQQSSQLSSGQQSTDNLVAASSGMSQHHNELVANGLVWDGQVYRHEMYPGWYYLNGEWYPDATIQQQATEQQATEQQATERQVTEQQANQGAEHHATDQQHWTQDYQVQQHTHEQHPEQLQQQQQDEAPFNVSSETSHQDSTQAHQTSTDGIYLTASDGALSGSGGVMPEFDPENGGESSVASSENFQDGHGVSSYTATNNLLDVGSHSNSLGYHDNHLNHQQQDSAVTSEITEKYTSHYDNDTGETVTKRKLCRESTLTNETVEKPDEEEKRGESEPPPPGNFTFFNPAQFSGSSSGSAALAGPIVPPITSPPSDIQPLSDDEIKTPTNGPEEDLINEDEDSLYSRKKPKPPAEAKAKPKEKKAEEKPSGGLFSRLFKSDGAKKMNLPDDSKPTIYWDNELNRYIDTSKGSDDEDDTPPPPPTSSSLPPSSLPASSRSSMSGGSEEQAMSAPASPGSSFRRKPGRGRLAANRYVDVMGGMKKSATAPSFK